MLSNNYYNKLVDICCRVVSTDGEVTLEERIWMTKLKENNRALDVGDKPGNFNVLQTADDQVLGILRSKRNDSIVFYANLSPKIKVINSENFFGFMNVLTGNQTPSTDQITLAPWDYVLLQNK